MTRNQGERERERENFLEYIDVSLFVAKKKKSAKFNLS